MILGIGTDLVDIRRIEKVLLRYEMRFENRCFSANEQEQANNISNSKKSAFYAKRFAAKEACVKALGTGFINDIFLKDIEVIKNNLGRPSLKLNNGALEILNKLTPENMIASTHLSLTDDYPYAGAFIIIEALPSN